MTTKKLKILHAPVNIGNQPWALSRSEIAQGCQSRVVINYNTWLNYSNDLCLSTYQSVTLYNMFKRFAYAMSAPLRFDVLHYYFGRTLMCWDDYGPRNNFWYMDLKLAKLLGRKTFMTLQGCDVRLAGLSDKNNQYTPCKKDQCSAYQGCTSSYDKDRQWLIDNILPQFDQVFFLNPELGYYLKKGYFLPYASVDVELIKVQPPRLRGIPKIIHAPSDPSIKGTDIILQALEQLKPHYEFEFLLIKNKTHAEAMQLYREADLAIDQVLCGWYGAFAVELMAMGKPVLCYIRDEDLHFIPKEMAVDLAIRRVNPATLAANIAAVLDARQEWLTWSTMARNFVLKWHNPRSIAQAMIAAYRSPTSEFNLAEMVIKICVE
ncbi:glycosyltransferase family 4 protein [soil metagenome]